jgi:Na+/melibiose symporter-like transporter
LTDVSEVLTASIIRAIMIGAVSISEMLVSFYNITRRNIPEDSHLHTRRRENLKSHQDNYENKNLITGLIVKLLLNISS